MVIFVSSPPSCFCLLLPRDAFTQPDPPEIHTPGARPPALSSMEVACQCPRVDSRWSLGSEESRIAQAQLVAAQHTKLWMHTGTVPANRLLQNQVIFG
jgi:hypothetical protein